MDNKKWIPLETGRIDQIKNLFNSIYPDNEYGSLGNDMGVFWTGLLQKSWDSKDERLKALDLEYNPSDPLSRIEQKTAVIAYADSIRREGQKSLETLDLFLGKWFPAVGGLHILPACTVVENRFNDGYFSQVERNNIHSSFGSNKLFADIVHRYFSMNDLVLGHVDIENPVFQKYLEGHDKSGEKFFVFTMEEYESLRSVGSFDRVFRPRPFPLFTIFRRLPREIPYRSLSHNGRADVMIRLIKKMSGVAVDYEVINILWLYNKLRNDQMLLAEDYAFITGFIGWLESKRIKHDLIFTVSKTQEVQHIPYILKPEIESEEELLTRCGYSAQQAEAAASLFRETNRRLFGEEIRALTTFSHVQVDVNTSTFEGLKALCEDLMWYLTKDLNMLRLDAVNYAFKKWGTSCFGLPELDKLMKIVYLSMECISPRMIPNLEVNDSLTSILKHMTSGTAAPPMMHDFHLASLMPVVFHTENPGIINRIFQKIKEFNPPHDSIRFSLSESHDGKSVRGSMDLLSFSERMVLTAAVKENGGAVKYKSVPERECSTEELSTFCTELGLEYEELSAALFTAAANRDSILCLKDGIETIDDITEAAEVLGGRNKDAAWFYFGRLIEGREPYELCITTRDSLPPVSDEQLEADRFLAFETLSFAVTGRNVKTVYFNDLLALPNDYKRVKATGELRNIKRTKVNLDEFEPRLSYKDGFEYRIVKGMNNLIALVDSDPALHYRGSEAEYLPVTDGSPAAVILNRCGDSRSLTIVNVSERSVSFNLNAAAAGFGGSLELIDNFTGRAVQLKSGMLDITLGPFGRLWLSDSAVKIPGTKLL